MGLNCWSDCWDYRCDSKPVNEIGHADYSESYTIDQMHVFELANGKFITVSESGCSCYESSEAEVELHLTKQAAISTFMQYKRSNSDISNLDYLEEIDNLNNGDNNG
jgi:hypothetical protein